MPGSCSSGLRSRPSGGIGNRRSNGLDVSSMNSRKPKLTIPITARMRATTGRGRLPENRVTASIQTASMKVQSSSEPSWPPQTPAIRYCKGRAELEFDATYQSEKSLLMKAEASSAKAAATSTNCVCAAVRATDIQARLPRAAPIKGTTPCTSATAMASTSAICPSSAIMAWLPTRAWCSRCAHWCPWRSSRPRRLRAACSSRHAWPALPWRRTHRSRRSSLARPRLCLL